MSRRVWSAWGQGRVSVACTELTLAQGCFLVLVWEQGGGHERPHLYHTTSPNPARPLAWCCVCVVGLGVATSLDAARERQPRHSVVSVLCNGAAPFVFE